MNDLRYGVLGPVIVTDGDTLVDLGGPKQRAVLAVLVASAGRSVSVDSLIDAVYGDEPHARARRTVQTYVSNLRAVIGDSIVRTGSGWTLKADVDDVDALVFEARFRAARDAIDATPEHESLVLREALSSWRGHPYSDVEAHGALDAETARLGELRVAALAARIDADLAAGRHDELIGEIEALLAEHPYQERFRAQHMLALYRAGRQREALRSYETMRGLVVEELGVEPTPEVRDLERLILDQDPSLDLAPSSHIERRFVVVVYPGDPIELARLDPGRRATLLDDTDRMLTAAATRWGGDVVGPAGVSLYATFRQSTDALAAATDIITGAADGVRLAIDCGEIETDDQGVSGPPISRAARLVAAAHTGQVLISPDAQQALSADGPRGVRLETLGNHRFPGLERELTVFQLLLGEPPRTFPPIEPARLPAPRPDARRAGVPGYELRAPIGRGSIGPVYAAYQASIGREVAIEVIGRAESSAVEFIRRFEADVQRLSLLEHPNVLPILDYWRDVDGAFIVYPHPRGGTLRDALGDADMTRALSQIGSALATAHRYGVVHGRLAPDRVMLDESGNCYVFGFPLAGVFEVDPADVAYVAPEALGGDPGVTGDVYSLGTLAYALATCDDPTPDDGLDLDQVGAHLSAAIATATATEPTARFDSIDELLDALTAGVRQRSRRTVATPNPYKGFAPFLEPDSSDFHGREALIAELVDAVRTESFVPLIGPSGVGKSSVVRAGLIPALRAGALAGSANWLVTDMVPGTHPFDELVRALERVAVRFPNELRERFADLDPTSLNAFGPVVSDQTHLLLVIDQLEELFTLAGDAERRRFLMLLEATTANDRISVVATLRADFLHRALGYSGLADLIRSASVMVRSPDRDELAEAIVAPAAQVGVTVDGGVTERLVNAVHDQPGALPLLQQTLTELFEHRRNDVITVNDYEATGGIDGAIARRAEAVYTELDPATQAAAKRALLHLVTVTEDGVPIRRRVAAAAVNDMVTATAVDALTRNRLVVRTLHSALRAPSIEVAHEALFTDWPRLRDWIAELRRELVLRGHLSDSIAEWNEHGRNDGYLLSAQRSVQYRDWADRTELAVTDIETEFIERSSRHHDRLLARRTRRRRGVLAGFAIAAAVASALAIVAAINTREARRQETIARQEAGRADEQADLARSNEELARDAEASAVEQESAALRNAEVARARELAVSALNVVDHDPELSVMLGSVAAGIVDPPAAALSALHAGLRDHQLVFTRQLPADDTPTGRVTGALSADGQFVGVAGLGGSSFELWSIDDPSNPRWTSDAPEGQLFAHVTFSPDGAQVGLTTWDQSVWGAGGGAAPAGSTQGITFHDATNGDVLGHVDLGPCASSVFQRPGHFVDSGRTMVVAGAPYDAGTGGCGPGTEVSILAPATTAIEPLATLAGGIGRDAVSMSDDQQFIALATNLEDVVVLDAVTGAVVHELPSRNPVAISRDGRLVLAGLVSGTPTSDPGGLTLLDAESGTEVRRLVGEETHFDTAGFGLDDAVVYAHADDGTLRTYDVSTGIELHRVAGQTGSLAEVVMSTDGRRLATFGGDGAARVWDLTAADEIAGYDLHEDPRLVHLWPSLGVESGTMVVSELACQCRLIPGAELSPDQVAESARFRVVTLDDGTERLTLPSLGQLAALHPDGDQVAFRAFAGPDAELPRSVGSIEIVDIDSGDTVATMTGLCDWDKLNGEFSTQCRPFPEQPFAEEMSTLEFSPDGRWLALGGAISNSVIVWDATTGEIAHIEPLADPAPPSPTGSTTVPPTAMAFDPTGGLLAVSSQTNDGFRVTVLDTSSWEVVAQVPTALPSDDALVFDPSGASMIVADWNGVIESFDTSTWQSIATFETGLPISTMAISPSGERLAGGTEGGNVTVWDSSTGATQQSVTYDTRLIAGVEFVGESELLVAPYEHAIQLLALDPAELVAITRSRITRGFSSQECATYGLQPCPTLEDLRGESVVVRSHTSHVGS